MNKVRPCFIAILFLFILFKTPLATAQTNQLPAGIRSAITATPSPILTATPSATPTTAPDLTRPEKEPVSNLTNRFAKRDASKLTATNLIAFAVQYSVRQGVPSNTIMLILLLPFLATIIVFFRYIIGLSGLGLLVPIALSITLLSTGLLAGIILLATILATSYLARLSLKRVRIMQLPKLALSMWLMAISIVGILTLSATRGILSVQDISIFPILLLILLSDRVVPLFLERSMIEVLQITLITFLLGLIGYYLLSWEALQTFVILYPETILLTVPLNIIMGRYFGLRATEYMRFKSISEYGHK
jgi:hypothetical protein